MVWLWRTFGWELVILLALVIVLALASLSHAQCAGGSCSTGRTVQRVRVTTVQRHGLFYLHRHHAAVFRLRSCR